MPEENKKVCPTCQGKKVIEGVCEADSEWRGGPQEDDMEDVRCTPEQECPTCEGKGYEE